MIHFELEVLDKFPDVESVHQGMVCVDRHWHRSFAVFRNGHLPKRNLGATVWK